jgi:hypothetical protein
VAIADRTYAGFEEAYWKQHPEYREQKQFTVEFFELMVKYTSLVVISGFLGIDSIKEMLHDVPIVEAILELSNIGTEALKDPLLILFGKKFLNLKLRKKDRRFIQLG